MQIKILKGFLSEWDPHGKIPPEDKIENKLRALKFVINGSNFAMCEVQNSVELSAMIVQLKRLGFNSIIIENLQQKFNQGK
jgi:hypothetical protein